MTSDDSLTICLLFPSRMPHAVDGARFLHILCQELPEFAPQFFGNYEPLRKPFQSIEEAVSHWKCPFLWVRRKAVKAEGDVWMDGRDRHSAVYICTSAKRFDRDAVVAFVKSCSVAFDSHFSYIHWMTQPEVDSTPYDIWHLLELGVTTHNLKKGIPNLGWATVFGKPYLDLIGESVLASAPAHAVERLSQNQFYLQITPELDDVRHDYASFARARARVRSHLGEEYFTGPEKAKAPTFEGLGER